MTSIPIVMGVASAILWRAFVPGSLSVEVYQWVYSTIVQAFAAMVAVVGMFAIYRLQFLRRNLETEAEKTVSKRSRKEPKKNQTRTERLCG